MNNGIYCKEIHVAPLKPIRVRKWVVTEDDKPILQMEEDVFDESKNVVGETWRAITDNELVKGKLKEAARNFPNYVRITKDEETLVAECDLSVTVQVGGFRKCEVVVYPARVQWPRTHS